MTPRKEARRRAERYDDDTWIGKLKCLVVDDQRVLARRDPSVCIGLVLVPRARARDRGARGELGETQGRAIDQLRAGPDLVTVGRGDLVADRAARARLQGRVGGTGSDPGIGRRVVAGLGAGVLDDERDGERRTRDAGSGCSPPRASGWSWRDTPRTSHCRPHRASGPRSGGSSSSSPCSWPPRQVRRAGRGPPGRVPGAAEAAANKEAHRCARSRRHRSSLADLRLLGSARVSPQRRG